MSIRRLGYWGLPALFLFVVALALIVINLIDGHHGEVAFTVGLVIIGALATYYTVMYDLPPAGVDDRGRSQATSYDSDRLDSGRRVDWLPAGVIAGLAGTTVLTIGLMFSYVIARMIGSSNGSASLLENWLWSLTHNPATDAAQLNLPIALMLHFGAGIVFGVIYAGWVEPRLHGTGWQRGALFALAPWILSIVIFLPLVDGGFLGFGLDAGPLPVIGNLILHLAYGASLGAVYAVEQWQTESGRPEHRQERRALDRSERVSAAGIAIGFVCGGLLGQIGASVLSPGRDPLLVAVIAAIIGSGIGFMLGSYAGLSPEPDQ